MPPKPQSIILHYKLISWPCLYDLNRLITRHPPRAPPQLRSARYPRKQHPASQSVGRPSRPCLELLPSFAPGYLSHSPRDPALLGCLYGSAQLTPTPAYLLPRPRCICSTRPGPPTTTNYRAFPIYKTHSSLYMISIRQLDLYTTPPFHHLEVPPQSNPFPFLQDGATSNPTRRTLLSKGERLDTERETTLSRHLPTRKSIC